MTHASLFSGIGGAELAASWMGWDNIFHCEINPFGRKVIEYWFPKSKSYEDIKTTDFREWRGKVDILTGGFPCQPFSQAGKRGGDTDDRYLWPEMLRAIREVHPTWVVGENVGGITSMVESGEDVEMGRGSNLFEESIIYRKEQKFTIERICEDFESIGYAIQPVLIPACAVGAPHRIDRVWFIAHCNDTGIKSEQGWEKLSHESESITDTGLQRQKKSEEFTMGTEQLYESWNITHSYIDRQRNRKNKQECVKWCEIETDNCVSSEDGITTNTNGNRYSQSRQGERVEKENNEIPQQDKRRISANRVDGLSGLQKSITNTESKQSQWMQLEQQKISNKKQGKFRGSDIISSSNSNDERLQRCKKIGVIRKNGKRKNKQSSRLLRTDWSNFPTQPPVCRRNDGLPFNVDNLTIPFTRWRQESIKAYGNAWVPQVSFEIFKVINELNNK